MAHTIVDVYGSKLAVAGIGGTGLTGVGFGIWSEQVLPSAGGAQRAFTPACVHIVLAIWTLCADVGGGGGCGGRICARPTGGTLRGVGYE